MSLKCMTFIKENIHMFCVYICCHLYPTIILFVGCNTQKYKILIKILLNLASILIIIPKLNRFGIFLFKFTKITVV